MGLQIDSQAALLGLDIKNPAVKLTPLSSKIRREPGKAEVKIQSQIGQVVVDNDPTRQAMGVFDFRELAKKAANSGQATVLAGIRRRVTEGNMMADIHKHGPVISKLAEMSTQSEQLQVEVKATPPAKVTYKPGFLDIEADIIPDKYDISFYNCELNLQSANVEVYLRQKNYLEITWTGDLLHTLG